MSVSFLKTGTAVQTAIAQADAQQEAKQQANDAPWRYRLNIDKEGKLTFLDGELEEDGTLKTVSYWEHQLKLNGKWGNFFTCTQDLEPCPICDDNQQPALVFAFTVIDHIPYTSQATGKIFVNQRKLFICKLPTFKLLEKMATKRGGLTGCLFEVARVGDKSAAVGSHFDFEGKTPLDEVLKTNGLEEGPFDYESVIIYKTADELRAAGHGNAAPLGSNDKPPGAGPAASSGPSTEDLAKQL